MKIKEILSKEARRARKKAKLEAKMTFIVASFLALVKQQTSGFSNLGGAMGTYRRFRIWDREQDVLHTGAKLALRYGEACEDLTDQFMVARDQYKAHLQEKAEEAAAKDAAEEAEEEAEEEAVEDEE